MPDMVLTCPKCDYKSTRAYNVRRHIRTSHNKVDTGIPPKDIQPTIPMKRDANTEETETASSLTPPKVSNWLIESSSLDNTMEVNTPEQPKKLREELALPDMIFEDSITDSQILYEATAVSPSKGNFDPSSITTYNYDNTRLKNAQRAISSLEEYIKYLQKELEVVRAENRILKSSRVT